MPPEARSSAGSPCGVVDVAAAKMGKGSARRESARGEREAVGNVQCARPWSALRRCSNALR